MDIFAEKQKNFTLIELLVVIAIIAILASMVFPSLRKARDMAKEIHCLNNFNNFGQACAMYRNDFDYYFQVKQDFSGNSHWYSNEEFRKYLNIPQPKYASSGLDHTGDLWPMSWLCPLAPKKQPPDVPLPGFDETVAVAGDFYYIYCSYGMNCEGVNRGSDRGFLRKSMKNPGQKINFIEADIWFVEMVNQSDPSLYATHRENWWWENGKIEYVRYPHNKASNILFYDAHAEKVSQHEVFNNSRIWDLTQ